MLQDMRMKFDDEGADVQHGDASVDRSQGAARAISVSTLVSNGSIWSSF